MKMCVSLCLCLIILIPVAFISYFFLAQLVGRVQHKFIRVIKAAEHIVVLTAQRRMDFTKHLCIRQV